MSKLARRAGATSNLDARPPREVILERSIGMIGDARMLQELRAWTYDPGRFDDADRVEPEPYRPDFRDQLEEAAGEGLLSREEFDLLVGAA